MMSRELFLIQCMEAYKWLKEGAIDDAELRKPYTSSGWKTPRLVSVETIVHSFVLGVLQASPCGDRLVYEPPKDIALVVETINKKINEELCDIFSLAREHWRAAAVRISSLALMKKFEEWTKDDPVFNSWMDTIDLEIALFNAGRRVEEETSWTLVKTNRSASMAEKRFIHASFVPQALAMGILRSMDNPYVLPPNMAIVLGWVNHMLESHINGQHQKDPFKTYIRQVEDDDPPRVFEGSLNEIFGSETEKGLLQDWCEDSGDFMDWQHDLGESGDVFSKAKLWMDGELTRIEEVSGKQWKEDAA